MPPRGNAFDTNAMSGKMKKEVKASYSKLKHPTKQEPLKMRARGISSKIAEKIKKVPTALKPFMAIVQRIKEDKRYDHLTYQEKLKLASEEYHSRS